MGKIGAFVKSLFKEQLPDHYTPSPITNVSKGASYNKLSELLPYLAWIPDKRLFILEGNEPGKCDSIGFCLEMNPQTGATEELSDLLATIFMQLPKGSGLQWILMATPLIDDFLIDYELQRAISGDQADREKVDLYRTLARRQAEHFRRGASTPIVGNQPYLLRDFRLVMSVVIPATSYDDLDFLNSVCHVRETCATTLSTYYQFRREWGPEDLINWCAVMLNPQETLQKLNAPHLNYDELRPIKEQIVAQNTVMRVTEDGLVFGLPQRKDQYVAKLMTVRSYPKAFTLNMMGALIGDYLQPAIGYTSPFAIVVGITTQDFEETRAATQMKSARAQQKAESPMARFLPELQDIRRDWDLAQQAFDEGKGTVKLYHQLVLFARPASDLAKAEQSAQGVWRNAQFEIVEDSYMQMQAILGSLPMSLTPSLTRDILIAKRMVTKTVPNAINMAPLIGEWRGVGQHPIIPFWGRRGQAMSVDIFANMSGNYNGAIAGASGSGKSVLLNSIALSYLGVGGRVWIIDAGRSFEKLCHTVGGQYIDFNPDNDIRLNPFAMVESIEEDIELMVPLFEQMISPTKLLDDYCRRQLSLHIQSVWYDRGRGATVDDLAYSLVNNCEMGGPNPQAESPEWREKISSLTLEERRAYCDPRIRDLGVQLSPFTQAGPYGRYFHGETNINFQSELIVLELDGLDSKPDLQAVIMFLLMYMITQNMYQTRARRKICIIDEAWALLGGGGSSEFIEKGYRRARKYNGSFITATQGIGDYYSSPSAEAAMTNADWMFLLRQKPESVLALEKSNKLVIDSYMKEMLLSLKTVQGAYSEVFIHGGQMGYGIGRVLFDPFSLLLVSSKAEDFEAVRHYRNQGYSVVDAIEAVLADRGVLGFVHKQNSRVV